MLNLDQTLNTELPQARYLLLELAALLDRVDQTAGRESCDASVRMRVVRSAIGLLDEQPDRAERVLRLYSESEGR